MAKRSRSTRELVKQLKRAFKAHYDAPPDWAWPYRPSIPFVGDEYEPGHGLLIYASAENLSFLNRQPVPDRYITDDAWDRYRADLEAETEERRLKSPFPSVGIQPFTDGGLPCAGLFIAQQRGLATRDAPRAFVETLAVSNWAKYTIRGSKNHDYANDLPKLDVSLPYVIEELLTLRPTVALVPATICRKRAYLAAMRGASPDTDFVLAYQFNPGVVNRVLLKHDAAAESFQNKMKGTVLERWMRDLSGFREGKAWRYFVHLEEALKSSSTIR